MRIQLDLTGAIDKAMKVLAVGYDVLALFGNRQVGFDQEVIAAR
jgi:hypothetical protein